MSASVPRAHITRWRTAIFAVFFVSGLGIATWASRVPALKTNLDINEFELGLLLLFFGGFSVLGLSLASLLLARFGARHAILLTLLSFGSGLALVGVGGELFPSYVVVAVGLAFLGLGTGSTDVMMNVEGAAIEQTMTRTIMPLFHAFFSFGTVAGAGAGALLALAHVGLAVNAISAGIVIVAVTLLSVPYIPAPESPARHTHGTDGAQASENEASWRERFIAGLAAWRDPRLWAVGVVVLGMAFAEGSANDWLSLAAVDGHGGTEAVGALALTIFATSMTIVRLIGSPLVDRFGRVWTLRVLAVAAAMGIVIFILAPSIPIAFIGVALWGAGASLGFPLGMSAAADNPARAAASVSAVAAIGYLAFLAGPPLLGWIAHQIGILPTLWIIVGLVVLSGLFSGAAKPIAGSKVGAGSQVGADTAQDTAPPA